MHPDQKRNKKMKKANTKPLPNATCTNHRKNQCSRGLRCKRHHSDARSLKPSENGPARTIVNNRDREASGAKGTIVTQGHKNETTQKKQKRRAPRNPSEKRPSFVYVNNKDRRHSRPFRTRVARPRGRGPCFLSRTLEVEK